MTIKIEAWQSEGIKKNECIDKFEFCCWDGLDKWLHRPNIIPHKCPKCKEEAGISANQMAIDAISAYQNQMVFPNQKNTKRWYGLEDIKNRLKEELNTHKKPKEN